MTLVTASIDIDAPRDKVFATALDPGRLDEWVTIHRRVNDVDSGEPREGYEVHYAFVRPSGHDLGEHLTPLYNDGVLRATVADSLPLDRARDAHERVEAGHVAGKLVLTVT